MSLNAFSPDWKLARHKVRNQPWASASLAALRGDYTAWRPQLSIPAAQDGPSEWIHHFFCHSDGTRLTFDPMQPHRHACPSCGRVYDGSPWDGAWRTIMHNAIGAQMERAALLIRLGEAEEATLARADLLGFILHYADHYTSYAVHGEHAGKGRIQSQSLDEAILIISIFRSLRWSGITLSDTEQERLRHLAAESVSLLKPQVLKIHNIHCWVLAALANAADFLRDTELLDWCRDNPFGVEQQIGQGFSEEGLWYEVNPGYHYYTVAALLSYVDAFGDNALSDASRERLTLALNNPPRMAYEGGLLPAYADGWPVRMVNEYAYLVEMAAGLLGGDKIDLSPYYHVQMPRQLRLCFETVSDTPESRQLSGRCSVAAIVYGPEELPLEAERQCNESIIWPDSGLAILCSESVRLGIRFGKDAGWHDHRDKLCLDVDVRLPDSNHWQSLDLGTSGYGSDFTQWLRSPLAHNLIIVDGAVQSPHRGKLIDCGPLHVAAESSFDDKHFCRTIHLDDHGWRDTYRVRQQADNLRSPELIWAFHGDGTFECQPDVERVSVENGETNQQLENLPQSIRNNLRWLQNLQSISVPSHVLKGRWSMPDCGYPISLSMVLPENFCVYTAEAGGNPNGRKMTVVMVCGSGNDVTFTSSFRIGVSEHEVLSARQNRSFASHYPFNPGSPETDGIGCPV